MPLRSFHEIEREMNAKGFTPEERAQVEADYKRTLREGIPGENLAGEMRNPTGADRVQAAGLLTGVLKPTPEGTTTAATPREPLPTDPGLIESLRSGFRESPMADYLRKNNPDLVSIGEPGPFQPAPGAKGILENLLHQAGRFGGQPLVIAGGAAGALPLAASMAAERAWEGSEAGETLGEMARHAAEEGALGLAMGKAGSRMRQAAEVTPASVRAVARQVLPLAAEAETMGAGGEAIQSAEQGQMPFTSLESLVRAAEGTQGGLALMGAARVLHGIMGAAGARGPRVHPTNEPGVTETGAGAGSTPPGPGGAETPPSEASEQPRWVEEEGGEGTGAGSTPPGAVEAVSPASAGGPSLSEEGVGRVLGMGLMRALDSGYVEVDPEGGFTLTDAGLSVVEGRGTGGEQPPPPVAPNEPGAATIAPSPSGAPAVPPEVPEEAIPPSVPAPGVRAQGPEPGPPTVPLAARPEGVGMPPPVDPIEQLLQAVRAGPPGKGSPVAGAAPGPPPSEAPAPSPRRPMTVEPRALAPRPAAPVEESRDLPPVVPPGPVEPPHPAPGPGAVPEPEEPAEPPPTREQHIAELQEALQDARREIATEQNPRGEPLSGEDIESAHQFAAELESRLRTLGVTPPGMPVLAPGKPVEARPSEPTTKPPTETPPAQPEAPAPPSGQAPIGVTVKPPKKGGSVTLGTGLGALGDFGTEDAQTAAIRQEAEVARQNPAVAKTLDTIRDEHEPTWRERLRKTATFDELYRRVVDRADPLKRAIRTMTEKPPAEWDPYTLQALAQGRAHGVTEDWLKYQPRDYHGKPVEGVKPLADIIRPFSADSDLADAWLKAKHALEVKAEGKEPGLDSDTARATIAALDSPRFRQLSTDVRAYTAAMRDYLQEMLKPEVRQWLGEHYPDYVPFRRLLGEDETSVPFTGGKAGAAGKGFVDLSNPVKRLEGSERDTRSPIAALMVDTGRVIRAVEANRVGLAMAETLGRDPATRSLVRKITQKELDAARADAPIVQVYSHGKRIPLELDPTMYTIAKALDRRTLGTVEKVLAYAAGKLRRGATNTPEFIPANWTRDQFTAFITMGVHPLRSIEGIAHALKADRVYQDWLAAGGDQAGWVALSNGNLQTKLADLYKNPSRFPKDTLLHPFQLLGAVSKLVEEGTRIGAFEAQRERMPAGTPYERSLVSGGYASREATVNFQRIGADMEALNAIIPFFNPGIQGPNRIVRAVRENPVGTLAKITAAVTIPSLILWSQNHNDPRYKALPAWEKWVFWHVMTKDHIWRIPKPWVEGFLFGSLPERFLDYLDQHDPKVFRGAGKAAADALFPPVVPIGMGLVENYGNWSWFKDRPIVPRGLEGVEGRYQATDYSSLTARKLGDVLNYSPAKIDNLIQSFTGGQGVLTVQAVDELLRHTTTLPGGEPPSRTLADVPGLKRFVSRFPNMQAQPIQDFYDRYAKAGQTNQTYKMLERTRSDQAEAYAKAHPEVFRMSGLAQVAKGLSANSKLIAGIQRDASLTGDQKRVAIETLTLESIRAAERANELTTKPAEPLAAMQERGAQAKDAREQTLQSIEHGVAEVATGGGNERLRQALQDMARKGAPVSSDDILRRMKSPTFLRQLFTEKLRRAPTPEERERAQNILQSLSQMGQIEALRHLPKSTRPAVLGTP